jgi:hypothetical protein
LNKVKKESNGYEYLIADGCQLPFVNNSLATLEHINQRKSLKFSEELKRTAKKWMIIYTPVAP